MYYSFLQQPSESVWLVVRSPRDQQEIAGIDRHAEMLDMAADRFERRRPVLVVPGGGPFADAVRDVAGGGTVLDPEVVSRLMTKRARSGPLAALTPREREVLSLMAEGRSNAAIAAKLFITEKAVSRHAAGIFANLGLTQSDDDNRRVLAVLAYLNS